MKKLLLSALAMLFLLSSTAQAAVNIRFAHGEAEDQTYGVYADMFAKKVEKLSNGEIKCTVFANGVMGAELQAGQKVQQGTLQMALVTSSNVGSLAPSANIMALPYLFSSPDMLMGEQGYLRESSPFRAELGRRILAESGKLRLLGVGTNGFRLLFTKPKPIQSMADLKGLKLRLPSNPVLQRLWENWGAGAYPISWAETFTAIQQGVADGYESPLDTLLKSGFYPYTTFVTENLTYTPQSFFLLVNASWFNKQPEKIQKLLVQAAAENDVEHFAWVQSQQSIVKQQLIEKGVTFYQAADIAEWEKSAVAIWPDLAKFCGGQDWVDSVLRFKKTGSF